ncbi:hypothetical protein VQ7734_03503 [Vibrio quintilis]|uniref:Uncharacterized protein n=1 Tax=Vibrio quintilis TaxID=1117707 RepID=A0A1M7YYU4_9VIBR|nr:hypothetical protein VQ7734_03503 [Vibrio quintilis]
MEFNKKTGTAANLAWTTNNAFTQEYFDQHEYASISGKQEIIMQVTTLGFGSLQSVMIGATGIAAITVIGMSLSVFWLSGSWWWLF